MAVSLTPDAQLRAMDLLDRWGVFASLAILILVIYRKEIGMLVLSLKPLAAIHADRWTDTARGPPETMTRQAQAA